MPPKKDTSFSDSCSKKHNRITVEVKKEIIAKHENGDRVTDIAEQYNLAKSTICTILKNKEVIKVADVARGVTVLTKQRSKVLEKVEKLLLVWINEKQQAGDNVSESIICEKAKQIHSDLFSKTPTTTGESDHFKASKGWFQKFRRRSGILSVMNVRHGEATSTTTSSDEKSGYGFFNECANLVESEGYIPPQVFSCDETGLFWGKMTKRTYITQEEKAPPGRRQLKQGALPTKFPRADSPSFKKGRKRMSKESRRSEESSRRSSHSEDPGLSSYDRGTDSSQDSTSTSKIEVKEEPEDAGYDQASGTPVTSEQNSTNDSRNSSPLPPVYFENSSPPHQREESPLRNQFSSTDRSTSQIPLNDLYAGSTIRSQLQGAIAGKKMDAVQNIVEGLLKKNASLLALSDAGSFKPNARRARATNDGFVRRSEPAYPSAGSASVFPVSSNLKAHVNASKKTSDTLKQRLMRPKSPTRKCESLLIDKTHFSYALMESKTSDEEIEKIFKVQNHELVCAISSKPSVADKNNKFVAALDFNYFWCNFCPFHTNNKSVLTQHILEHRFACKYCAYESFCRSDVVRHMQKVHQEFADSSNSLLYCTLLSDYLRVKARTDGKENKDPDDDVDEIDPQLMEAAAKNLSGRKRAADNYEYDDDEPNSPSSKSAKFESEEAADIPQSSRGFVSKEKPSKSRKSSNPKRHPPPKDSDYDMFDMEVEEISENQEDITPEESDSEKVPYSSNLNSPNPHTGQEHPPYPTGMMQVIPSFRGSPMQTFTTTHVPKPAPAPISGPRSPPRPGYRKKTTPSSSRLYWSCGYCTFQSNSQSQIKDHSNLEHPGKPHRYVALIKNMTPDNIIQRSPRKPNTKYQSAKHTGPLGNIPPKPSRSPHSYQSHDAPSPHASNDSTLNGEDNDDDISLVEKVNSPSLLKVKINSGKATKKESTVYRCYHCTYTAKRHSSMKSHIYYKHRGKALVAVDDESEATSQIFFCARDDCTFKSDSGSQYLNHVDQCTPWNKPELADVEVEPHIRECLEQTVEFAEMAKEKIVEQTMLSGIVETSQETPKTGEDEASSVMIDTDIRIERRLSFESEAQDSETPTASPIKDIGLSPETDTSGLNEFQNGEKQDSNFDYECHVNKSKFTQNVDVICESPKGIESEPVNLHEDLALDTDDELSDYSNNVEISDHDVDKDFDHERKSESVLSPNETESSDLLNLSISSYDNFIPVGIIDKKCQEVAVNSEHDNDIESGVISDTVECNVGFSPQRKTVSVSPQRETVVPLSPRMTMPSPRKGTCVDIERNSPYLGVTPPQREIVQESPGPELMSHLLTVTDVIPDKELATVSLQREAELLSHGKALLPPQEVIPLTSQTGTVQLDVIPQEEEVISSPRGETGQPYPSLKDPSLPENETATQTSQIGVITPSCMETIDQNSMTEPPHLPLGEPGVFCCHDNGVEQIITDNCDKYQDDFKYPQPAAYEVVEAHTEFDACCDSEQSKMSKEYNENEHIVQAPGANNESASGNTSSSKSLVEDEGHSLNTEQNSIKDIRENELTASSKDETPGTKAKQTQGNLTSPTGGSSLKLTFKMLGHTTVCSMSSQEIESTEENQTNTEDEDSSSSSDTSSSSNSSDSEEESDKKEEETDENNKQDQPVSQDPKWLQDLIDSTGDSDSDLGSNPRSVPLSVSSVSEVCENYPEFLSRKNTTTSKDNLDVSNSTSQDQVRDEISIEEEVSHLRDGKQDCSQEKISSPSKSIEPKETDTEKLCYAYVPARSAAMKALSKMKPSLEDEERCAEDIDPPESFKSKKSSCKGKLPTSKSYSASNLRSSSCPSLIPTTSALESSSATCTKSVSLGPNASEVATIVKKSSPSYMCRYCIDIDEGSLKSIKQHVLSLHKSMPPMVINCFKQRRHRKCQFYICPHPSCYKLSCSRKEFETHQQTHMSAQSSKRPKVRSAVNGLGTTNRCGSLKNVENVALPTKTSVTALSFPACRVELDMLDLKKIKSFQNVSFKQEEKKYQCLYCTDYFFRNSLADMKSHYGKEHEGQLMVMRDTEARRAQLPSRIYVCDNPNCESSFVNRSDLDHHIKSHKSNFTYIHECACCGWYSSSHSAAIRHLKSEHEGEESASLVHMQVTVNEYGETSKKIL